MIQLLMRRRLDNLFNIFLTLFRGLDNAGKTTILKKFNGEDIDTISPTLGFNIKTLEHRGWVSSRNALQQTTINPYFQYFA